MKKNRIWRGFTTITASLLIFSVGAGNICESWKDMIDQNIGTTSSIIKTSDKSAEGTYTYTSDYSTTGELVQAHKDLNEQLSEEGSVLLKNNGTLPIKEGAAVTLFGTNSHYPYYAGAMGGSVDESEAVSLEQALTEKGYQVNPTMISLYETLGQIEGEPTLDMFGNEQASYAYRPGKLASNLMTGIATAGYAIGEAPVSLYEETEPGYAESFKQYSDAAIVVVGRTGTEGADYYAGEAGLAEGQSASDPLGLCEEEREMIQLACDNFDKVIVLVNTVNQMEIDELENNEAIDAILWVGFPGCYGFYGVADILDGVSNPSGHLADTYAVDNSSSAAAQNWGYTLYTNADQSNYAANYVVEQEGIYIGYKYYETRYYDLVTGTGNADSANGSSTGNAWNYEDEVTYGFGYGLSYTTFEQTIDSVKFNEDKTATVQATVTNTGNVAGKDVVQIYAQSPYTDYDKENLVEKAAVQLMDYVKTDMLEPGQSQQVETTFHLSDLASYDENNAKTYIMDAGDYYFSLGNGAHDALNNILAAQGYTQDNGMDYDGNAALTYTWNQPSIDTTTYAISEATGEAITNQLDDADINYWAPETVTYLSRQDWDGTWPELVQGLEINEAMAEYIDMDNYEIATDEDTSDIFPEKDGDVSFLEMKGADFDDERWDKLLDEMNINDALVATRAGGGKPKAYKSINMIVDVYESDGAAGFSNNSIGVRSVDSDSPVYVSEDDEYYDYTLADMVCEAVVASTFSKELAEAEGNLFGNDSLWTNITRFLAPSMNLHRTPYNGRNDEYYSEDAMLTKYTGGAVVKGAVSKGCQTVVKHFAFNDQESGRIGVSTFMTEQAARETELRGFEGAIENGTLALMSSFNRIGIIYDSAHVGLLTNILRNEWGYKGYVCTDMLQAMCANYMTCKESVIAGTTLMGISADSLAGNGGAWSYFTEDGISGDATLTQALRTNTKYLLYAIANSNAMNGINQTSKVSYNITWWRAIYLGVGIAMALLTILGAIMYFLTGKKEKKGEE